MSESVGSAAQMTGIISKYLDPPDERIIREVFQSIERAMDGVYKLHKMAKILPQTPNIQELLVILISTRREFYGQCERIATLFKNLSVHSVSYVDFASLVTTPVARNQGAEARHFNNLLQDTNKVAVHIQRALTIQTQGLQALEAIRESLTYQTTSRHHHNRPFASLVLQTLRVSAQPVKLDSVVHFAREKIFSKEKMKASHRRNLLFLVNGISEEITQGLACLRELREYYYRQFSSHLCSLIDTPHALYSVSRELITQADLKMIKDDLVRMKESWTRFDYIIGEGVSRLGRAADAIRVIESFDGTGTSSPTSTQTTTSRLSDVPPPLPPRPSRAPGSSLSPTTTSVQ